MHFCEANCACTETVPLSHTGDTSVSCLLVHVLVEATRISKAFHRIIVDHEHRKFLKFLWLNLESYELHTYQFKVVLFGAMLTIPVAGDIANTSVPKRGG